MESSNRILYTPSSFAKKNLLHLQEIGQLEATSPHDSKRENLSSYLFFMVTSGSGSLRYEGISYPLIDGDCVFIDCRKPYSHSTGDNLWHLKWVHFYGPNMDAIYAKYVERGGTPAFHPKDVFRYETLISTLNEIAASSSYVKDMSICEKLTALLTLLMEDSWHRDQHPDVLSKKQNLQQIKEYLDQNYQHRITLDNLAELFFVNKFYLSRIFKEQYDVTINNYLQQVRITHAKQLLRFSGLSMDKIAVECGMNDANYFARVFKKVEGISPGEFRRIW
ncbi:helix-turn-helix transcriptional regulator [Faecalicatena faecalis]|nr:AraC family transcriptional regulator [Faecalicatena faecalis]